MYKYYLPDEIVETIIDFIDYQKYHSIKYKKILKDINDIYVCFSHDDNLQPTLVNYFWGNYWYNATSKVIIQNFD